MLDTTTTLTEATLMRDVLATLNKHYPGHVWAVEVSGGVLGVKAPGLNGLMGFAIRQDRVSTKRVVMAGGEILERFRQRRAAMDIDQYRDARRNIRGDAVPLN
jgi:hypothetical protein